jgi:hypothetical protein
MNEVQPSNRGQWLQVCNRHMNPKECLRFQILVLCLCAAQLPAATSSENPRLAGIINLPGFKQALVQNVRSTTGNTYCLLSEGEREGDVELAEIQPGTGSVTMRISGKNESLILRLEERTPAAVPTIALEQAELAPVLRWYAQLTQRNLLRFPSLQATRLNLSVVAADEKATALKLEQALAEKGVAVVPDGDKFAVIVPTDAVKSLGARPRPPDAHAKLPAAAVLSPGMIFLSGVDARQVVRLYAELVERQFEPGESFKAVSGSIHFLNQTALTREEVRYALDTLFAWQGFEVVPVGEKELRCVASGRHRQ